MARKTPIPSRLNPGKMSAPLEVTAKRMLETALVLYSDNRSIVCAEVEKPIAEVCAGAQASGMKAETLIVELKRIWHSVPETESREKAEVISRLVTMCIREFYRAHPEGPATG